MKITRTSQLSGIKRTIDLPVTQEQMDKFNSGESYVQDIFPNLTPDQREFIMTGIDSTEWSELFPGEEKD